MGRREAGLGGIFPPEEDGGDGSAADCDRWAEADAEAGDRAAEEAAHREQGVTETDHKGRHTGHVTEEREMKKGGRKATKVCGHIKRDATRRTAVDAPFGRSVKRSVGRGGGR